MGSAMCVEIVASPAVADFYSACSNVGKLANLNCRGNGGNLHDVSVSFAAIRLIVAYGHEGTVHTLYDEYSISSNLML